MQTPRQRFALVLVALAWSAGCASGGGGFQPARDPDVIGGPELKSHPELSALELIRRERPVWLNERGGDINVLAGQNPRLADGMTSPRGIRVYMNGVITSDGLEALERIQALSIREMRKLSAVEASLRFGVGHTSGAILVTTQG